MSMGNIKQWIIKMGQIADIHRQLGFVESEYAWRWMYEAVIQLDERLVFKSLPEVKRDKVEYDPEKIQDKCRLLAREIMGMEPIWKEDVDPRFTIHAKQQVVKYLTEIAFKLTP